MLKVKNKEVAFTISAKNRLPSAMICRDSFLKYNPNTDFYIFLADQTIDTTDVDLIIEAMPVIACNELKQLNQFRTTNKLEEMAYKYNIIEFCTAVKPFCIEYLFWSGYNRILYFDPDIKFYDDVSPIYLHLHDYNCVLTPHITSPLPNDKKHQQDLEILSCGAYNLGFCGFSRSQDTLDFLTWWGKQLEDYCFVALQQHLFVDQYWMMFAPCFLNTHILKCVGYNAAYWNLHERTYQHKNKKWFVNGEPLVFYHFSGLEYLNPVIISKHQNRFSLKNRHDIVPLFADYISDIMHRDGIHRIYIPYYYDNINATALTANDRRNFPAVFQKTANPWLDKEQKHGLNIVGHFPYVAGTAEVARNFVQKIYSTGIPYILYPLHSNKEKISLSEEKEFGYYYNEQPKFDTNIFFVNLDSIGTIQFYKPELFTGRNIGVPWWEIEDELPFHDNFDCVNEIICFTDFMQRVIKKFSPDKKVYKLPYPFIAPKPGTYISQSECMAQLNIHQYKFVYYFNFDYASSYERKNPLGLIKAFAQVAKKHKDVVLLIKTLNAKLHPTEANRIDHYCTELDCPVIIYDGVFPKSYMHAIMNMCDCYVSLHRAEGAGLGILEALYFGKPVIATAYGGNMEFMDDSNSLPVAYKKVNIQEGLPGYYSPTATWAEPDLDDAIEKMEKVLLDGSLRYKLSRQAKSSVVEYANMFKFNQTFYKVLNNE